MSGFYGIPPSVIGLDEPVFIPRITGRDRCHRDLIATDRPEIPGDTGRLSWIVIKVFPVNDLSLRVICEDQPELMLRGKTIDRDTLGLRQRCRPDKISGRSATLILLDELPRSNPSTSA